MQTEPMQEILTFTVASEPGNERQAMRTVADSIAPLGVDARTSERLQTAVAETVLNAMEHGHQYDANKLVRVCVVASTTVLCVTVTDEGGRPLPGTSTQPDLMAKLEGAQPARGWGLFLIRHMVDEMEVEADEHHHTVRLLVWRQRPPLANSPASAQSDAHPTSPAGSAAALP